MNYHLRTGIRTGFGRDVGFQDLTRRPVKIAHEEEHAGQLRRQAPESPLLARLKARGLLS